MMNRLRDGLVYPREVLKYAKDNVLLVLLYILLFALLSGTRTIIDTIKYEGISYDFKQDIESQLDDVDTTCAFVSSAVVCEDQSVTELFNLMTFTFYIDSNESMDFEGYDSLYNFVFHEDQVLVIFSGIEVYALDIDTLPVAFHDLDFSKLQTDERDDFYDQLYEGINEYLVDTKLSWGIGIVFMEMLMNSLMFFGFILFSSYFLYRRFKVIPYRDAFVLTTYASTSIFVVLVFYNLLQLPFLLVIVLVILAFRQNNQMVAEIERRLKKPLDK